MKGKPGTLTWLKHQVAEYIREKPHYETCANVLTRALKEACRELAPQAIIQARAKATTSFAEKAMRKAHKYDDPAHQITDLCGARVITDLPEEARMVCEFVRANFDIDEANSDDTRRRLRTNEFGYLGVHFIVQMKADGSPAAGTSARETQRVGRRKAEIQVKTLLQHAGAAIGHDRLYKTAITVPEKLDRQAAMLAAALENADGEFASLAENLDAYTRCYTAYMKPKEMNDEMDVLDIILAAEKDTENKHTIALRIAAIARAADDDDRVIKVLSPFSKDRCPHRAAILAELGYAICHSSGDKPGSASYRQGQRLLGEAVKLTANSAVCTDMIDKRAMATHGRALSWLAWSYSNIESRKAESRNLYREALGCDPSNPYHLSSFIEYEIYCTGNRELPRAMEPALRKAIDECRSHVEVRIELPRAFLTMGRFHLLLGEPYESLSAYAKAVHFCITRDVCVSPDMFERELRFLTRVNHGHALPEEHTWVEKMLLLAAAVKLNDGKATPSIRRLAVSADLLSEPVAIIAGGADPAIRERMRTYTKLLEAGLAGFEGTVISGGTRAGVPGIVGGIAQRQRKKGEKRFTAVGYLPKFRPSDAPIDRRYDELVIFPDGDEFTPREILQNWIDILTAKIHPSQVRVLGINGGKVASFEYELALAMGALVGVIESSGRAANDLWLESEHWSAENLVWLPEDKMSIRALVQPDSCQMTARQLKVAARAVHNKYREDNKHEYTHPSMLPWRELEAHLKDSNRQQAAYMETILRSEGFGIRKAAGEPKRVRFRPEEVERMAEMEHGRWNVERLSKGWRYGSDADRANKVSPYLVPWKALPREIQEYDLKAVRDWPDVLADVGLEIYRLPKKRGKGQARTRRRKTSKRGKS